MTEDERNSDQGGAKLLHDRDRNRVPVIIAVLLFLCLAVGVFTISERQAQKLLIGFPDFADSPFVLTDQNGDRRSNADFAGQPIALFFGFTYCPDVCPTTLMSLANSLDELSDDGVHTDKLQIIFVSVDAERDTPQQLRDYLGLFEMNVVGLTGDAQALADSRAVTATFNGEFVGSAAVGDLVECTGEVVKAGRSMVFVRGLIVNASRGGDPMMSFSAVLKKTAPRRG